MDAPGQYRRTLIDLLRLGHHHGPAGRRELYASPDPGLTDFPEWDALLAAAAEHLAVIHGETPPDWSRMPGERSPSPGGAGARRTSWTTPSERSSSRPHRRRSGDGT